MGGEGGAGASIGVGCVPPLVAHHCAPQAEPQARLIQLLCSEGGTIRRQHLMIGICQPQIPPPHHRRRLTASQMHSLHGSY